ncbi:MAG: hypothetical protein AAGB51_03170 [Planctomycetota bacterium]
MANTRDRSGKFAFASLLVFAATAAYAAPFAAPCPVACATTPGGAGTVIIETTEAEYSCCNAAGACKVCDACPWYLELWC